MYKSEQIVSHSDGICLPSLRAKKQADDSFPYGDSIGSIYPVLQKVLQYLPYAEVVNISKINNKNWMKLARSEIKRRCKITSLYLIENESLVLKSSFNVNFEHVEFLFFLYNHKKLRLNDFVCVHYADHSAERKTGKT